jgi:hypothetical protein
MRYTITLGFDVDFYDEQPTYTDRELKAIEAALSRKIIEMNNHFNKGAYLIQPTITGEIINE